MHESEILRFLISEREFTPVKLFDVSKKKYASKYEAQIANILEEANIPFRSQEPLDYCRDIRVLPFDFFLPDYEAFIEVHGQQHYKSVKFFGGEEAFTKTLSHDKKKRKCAIENDYGYIEIPYSDIKPLNQYNIKQYIESKLETL